MGDQPDGADVLVVGGGVFGVTAALELARRGRAVSLVDPGPLPHPLAASTDISKLVRMDYGADDLYAELAERARDGWLAWNARWDEPLYHEDGLVVMAGGPMAPGGFEYESYERLRREGRPVTRLDARALEARFPVWVADRYPDGYLNPRAGWAASGTVMARLAAELRASTARVSEAGFASFLEEGSRVAGIATADGRELRASTVLVAVGAWTPSVLPHLADRLWATGQPVFHLRPEDPDAFAPPRFVPWTADIARTGWYGFPLVDGVVKVANHGPGRRVRPDDPREVAPEDEARCREFLADTFPKLATAPVVSSRLCLYCDSWDGNFYVDHDPDRPGLVVAAGDSGHAFKFAPVLGPLVADVVERAPNPFASRFAWRPRGAPAFEDARHADR